MITQDQLETAYQRANGPDYVVDGNSKLSPVGNDIAEALMKNNRFRSLNVRTSLGILTEGPAAIAAALMSAFILGFEVSKLVVEQAAQNQAQQEAQPVGSQLS